MTPTLMFTIVPFHLLVVLVPVSAFVLYKSPRAFHYLLALFLGVLVGYINLHTDEVIFPVLLLIAFGFFLGFAQRRNVWLCAVLLAVWIPVGQLVQLFVESQHEALTHDVPFSLIAFVPALVGCYAGDVLKKMTPHASTAHDQL